jgi:hypothetical protein
MMTWRDDVRRTDDEIAKYLEGSVNHRLPERSFPLHRAGEHRKRLNARDDQGDQC